MNGTSAIAVVVSLTCFVAAGVFGILANRSRAYDVTHTDALLAMLNKAHWKDTEPTARGVCAYRNVLTIASLRNGNNSKATQVTIALAFQVAAIAALGVGVGRELWHLL